MTTKFKFRKNSKTVNSKIVIVVVNLGGRISVGVRVRVRAMIITR